MKLYEVGINLGAAEVIRKTDLGIRVRRKNGSVLDVPRGALHRNCEISAVGDRGMLIVHAWFLVKAGMVPNGRAR